jgi:hypothetical protein
LKQRHRVTRPGLPAAGAELFLHGSPGVAVALIAVLGMAAMTLLFHAVFKA